MSDMIKFDSMDDARAFTLGINAIIAAAVAEERAAVVAWLRARHAFTKEWDGRVNAVSHVYNHAADIIERGEHRREGEP